MSPSEKEQLAERRSQQKLEGAIALTEYQAKERATRLLTGKLRAERLARESKPPEAKSIARLIAKPSKRPRKLTAPLSQALLEVFLASIAPSPQWAVRFVHVV